MGVFGKAVLYTALLAFANAAAADTSAAAALRAGDMRKLVFHEAPQPVPDAAFGHLDGSTHSLADFRGKWVLLNFWATWCAPCREEMPMLANLQRDLGGDRFAVVTVATGRNSPQAIEKFFDEIGVDNLPLYVDPRHDLARPMAVLGLPVTVIIDPEGREVARLMGEAAWDGPEARALLAALMQGS
ncbi:MAG: TlpA family protein disulfide reductase [Rhodobacteraceae bacterium]|nr:TlpA family protein disulfide reductase [Paracoccaceae bacterium]